MSNFQKQIPINNCNEIDCRTLTALCFSREIPMRPFSKWNNSMVRGYRSLSVCTNYVKISNNLGSQHSVVPNQAAGRNSTPQLVLRSPIPRLHKKRNTGDCFYVHYLVGFPCSTNTNTHTWQLAEPVPTTLWWLHVWHGKQAELSW